MDPILIALAVFGVIVFLAKGAAAAELPDVPPVVDAIPPPVSITSALISETLGGIPGAAVTFQIAADVLGLISPRDDAPAHTPEQIEIIRTTVETWTAPALVLLNTAPLDIFIPANRLAIAQDIVDRLGLYPQTIGLTPPAGITLGSAEWVVSILTLTSFRRLPLTFALAPVWFGREAELAASGIAPTTLVTVVPEPEPTIDFEVSEAFKSRLGRLTTFTFG